MAKVMAPAPPAGYVRRASLLHRVDTVLDRRLTVLQAPGGFGKTTVLADVSHRKKKQGVIAAWLSLDRDDTADVFGHYLARAFEHAGLNLSTIDDDDAWSSSPFKQQLGMLARAIELHADPCLLVLDEVELLPSGTVESIDLLLKRSPRNLHVAMAFRSNPGLDLAEHFLDGSAIVLKARQFRFSRPEIARFFDRALSRRELATVEERTAGWPVALMVDRNMRAVGAEPPDVDAAGFSENYVGVRLLRGLSKQDRESLFDLAVFDWIDAELVDEVLGSNDARLRVSSLKSLDGLVLPVDGDDAVWRLHPLVREYCADRFTVEDPVRKRLLHTRIARALARRGHLGPAWRHATSASDGRLVGELIENVGVFGLWAREGLIGLTVAGRFVTSEIVAMCPRLALVRCVHLQLASKFDEAAALYETVAQETLAAVPHLQESVAAEHLDRLPDQRERHRVAVRVDGDQVVGRHHPSQRRLEPERPARRRWNQGELDVDRKTVRRCLRQTEWKPYQRAARADTLLATHASYLRRRAADVGYSAQVLVQIPERFVPLATATLIDLIVSPDAEEEQILGNIAAVVFGTALLLADPLQADRVSNPFHTGAYVDASVLLPWLAEGHPLRLAYDSVLRSFEPGTVRVLSGYLNEIVSHRRLAREHCERAGFDDENKFKRYVNLFELHNVNVFLGGYAGTLERGSKESLEEYLERVAPFSSEMDVRRCLEDKGLLIEDYALQDYGLAGELKAALRERGKIREDVVVAHDAAQMEVLRNARDPENRGYFITADRALVSAVSHTSSRHVLPHVLLPQQVGFLARMASRSTAGLEAFSRTLWTVREDVATKIRRYYTNRVLREYEEGLVAEIDSVLDAIIGGLRREDVSLTEEDARDPRSEVARIRFFERLDRFEPRFFQHMDEARERARKRERA